MMEPEIDRHLAEMILFYRLARQHRAVSLRTERAPWAMVNVQCVCGVCYDRDLMPMEGSDGSEVNMGAPIVYMSRHEEVFARHGLRYHIGRCRRCGTTNVMFCEELQDGEEGRRNTVG